MQKLVRSLVAAGLWALGEIVLAQGGGALQLGGTWEGKYSYVASAGRREVAFVLELSMRNTSLTGRMTEPNTFGERSSDQLFAKVVGVVEGRRLRLIKTYDGTAGQRHSVYYEGTVDPASMTVTGSWILSDQWGGTFEAKRR
jgi:hypothetical protein